MSKILGVGVLLGALLVGSSAQAIGTTDGCTITSPIKSRDWDGALVPATEVIPPSPNWNGSMQPTIIATAPSGLIVLLTPIGGGKYVERPLYWPTPDDPQYAYRKMKKLPVGTKFRGNDYNQRIVVLARDADYVADDVTQHYTALNYNGYKMVIDGCGGYDELYGGNGDDHIVDMSGYNKMYGGAGRDWLEGAASAAYGNDGDDCISVGVGIDTFARLYGGDGNDVLSGSTFKQMTINDGGPGVDACYGGSNSSCEAIAEAQVSCDGWL